MANKYKDEIDHVRRISDDLAFSYITEKYSGQSEQDTLDAINIIKHRPWKKKFHKPLAEFYIPSVHRDTFNIAIPAFLTFMKKEDLCKIVMDVTKNDSVDRYFAYYYLGILEE